MKKKALLLLICVSGLQLNAQIGLDSLYAVWQDQSETDSARVDAYKTYIWDGYLFSDPDSAAILAEALHAYAEKHNYPKAANQALTLQGIVYEMQGNYPLALEYLQKSLAADEAIGNKWGISETLIVIGVLYDEQGDLPRALEYYNKALAIDEEIGNKEGMAMSLNNIGNILYGPGEHQPKHLRIGKKPICLRIPWPVGGQRERGIGDVFCP